MAGDDNDDIDDDNDDEKEWNDVDAGELTPPSPPMSCETTKQCVSEYRSCWGN